MRIYLSFTSNIRENNQKTVVIGYMECYHHSYVKLITCSNASWLLEKLNDLTINDLLSRSAQACLNA